MWITGASSGIGEAVALEISKEKANLILSGRNENALNWVGGICKSNGSAVQIIPFDLGDEQAVQKAAEIVLANNEKIDCLYHFGGISQRSFVSETPLSIDRKILEINFFGTVALTKAVLPLMIKIIFTCRLLFPGGLKQISRLMRLIKREMLMLKWMRDRKKECHLM